MDPDTIVLTGGLATPSLVTELTGLGGQEVTSRDLPSLPTGRWGHACGAYTVAGEKVGLSSS